MGVAAVGVIVSVMVFVVVRAAVLLAVPAAAGP